MLYTTLLGAHRMLWDQVERIEMDPQDYTLILYPREPGGRLSVFGPSFWGGPDAQGMSQLLQAQVRKRRISLKQTMRAQYTLWGAKGLTNSTR